MLESDNEWNVIDVSDQPHMGDFHIKYKNNNKKHINVIPYLKSLPTCKPEDYIKVFKSKYKKFIKQYNIVVECIKPKYAKGLIMLGALPMVRAEHTEHEPVKPHVKNKKAS